LKFTRFLTLALLAVAFSPVFAARPDDYVIEKEPADVGLIHTQRDIKPYFQVYRQTVEIVFTDDEPAGKAQIAVLPLHNGKKWAVSCRWDDNTPSDIRMMELMDKDGMKGTFYVNGREQGYWGEKYDYDGRLDDIASLLVASGNHTLGGHGDRHPSLGYLNRNRLWQEVMRVRIDREAQTDEPICSYSFSNMNWSNDVEGLEVTLDIAEALYRAGYYHNANSTYLRRSGIEMPAANLLPWDKANASQIENKIAEFTTDESLARTNPNFTFNMHAAAINPEFQWQKYDRLFEKYKGRDEWWYCNQSEYGAYRLQYEATKVERRRVANKVSLELRRPALSDLNDEIPLSFEITAAPKESVQKVTADSGKVEPFDAGESYRFNLYHNHNKKLPEKIGWIANKDNHQKVKDTDVGKDFGGLKGVLYLDGTKLGLELVNGGNELRDIRVTYRLPLAWNDGVQVRHEDKIAANACLSDEITLKRAKTGFNYDIGVAFYAAQVDFTCADKAYRLYLTTSVRSDAEDTSYPVGRLAFLGPIPDNEFSTEMAQAAAKGELKSVGALKWQSTKEYTDFLHANALLAEKPAAEHNLQGKYLLRTIVESPEARQVQTIVGARRCGISAIYVNGAPAGGDRFELKAGDNNLLLVFGARGKRAPMFGLVTPETGMMLKDIKYRLPETAD
jgi:peptidoglycan/xylan/chitin deacetylase (PgdA/CDA1 family)